MPKLSTKHVIYAIVKGTDKVILAENGFMSDKFIDTKDTIV